jgi:hypothetical protein
VQCLHSALNAPTYTHVHISGLALCPRVDKHPRTTHENGNHVCERARVSSYLHSSSEVDAVEQRNVVNSGVRVSEGYEGQEPQGRGGLHEHRACCLLSTPSHPSIYWLGGPCITKRMKSPQRHGAGFNPPIIFCACSRALWKMLQMVPKCSRTTFAQNKKFYPQNVFLGFVTPPPHTKAYGWPGHIMQKTCNGNILKNSIPAAYSFR